MHHQLGAPITLTRILVAAADAPIHYGERPFYLI
jgi:hypothetical protein